ncbi:MAG: mechanosensitive ion channel family protein [Cyanobacteria bacterium J06632_3]
MGTKSLKRCWQTTTLTALLILLVVQSLTIQHSWAQSSAPTAPSTAPSATEALTSNGAVNRLLPEQWVIAAETVDTAPIYLDGRTLFQVSAPADPGQQPAETRAQKIQKRLNELAREQQNDSSLITITTDNPSELPEIVVGDQRLLTVTSLDAQINGQEPSERAIFVADDIRMALENYRLERQPEFLWQQARVATGILFIAGLLQLLIRRISHRLQKRQLRLAKTNTQLGQASRLNPKALVVSPDADKVNNVFDLLKARLDNRQKRKINEAARGLLVLLQIGLWGGSLLWILFLFPYSRWVTTIAQHWIQIPARILLIAGLAYVAMRISSLIIDKVGLTLQSGAQWAPEQSQRLSLRFSTFSQVAKGIVGSLIFAIMTLAILTVVGVKIAPLLAGAGIVGVGISLAAQSLIKDIINGSLILFEDQFGIGDVISVEGQTGTVESLNLRITQLRNTEGCLITIPNSQIGIIQNLSKDWSQVDLSIKVATDTDLTEALTLLNSTAANLAADPDWQQLILEPPDLLGVETVDHMGISLRLLLKTQPLKQWPVARELRRRLKEAFEDANITIGVPTENLSLSWENNSLENYSGKETLSEFSDVQALRPD